MNDQQLEAELRRATRGSIAGISLVGVGTFVMGLFAGLCGFFRWDPEMAEYGTGTWVAYIAMVVFFLVVGFGMGVAAVFVVPRKGRDFVDRVMRRPESFSRLWLLLVKHKYNPASAPGQVGVGTSLCADTVDGVHFQFMVKGANADGLLQAIAARAPNAKLGPP